jgi:hypothetical protein
MIIRVSDQREKLGDVDKQLSQAEADRLGREEELKFVEAQLVAALVDQQRRLMDVLASVQVDPHAYGVPAAPAVNFDSLLPGPPAAMEARTATASGTRSPETTLPRASSSVDRGGPVGGGGGAGGDSDSDGDGFVVGARASRAPARERAASEVAAHATVSATSPTLVSPTAAPGQSGLFWGAAPRAAPHA